MRAVWLCLLVVLARPGAADWQIESVVDPLTDDETRAAVVENEEGFSLAIFRDAGGVRVNAVLRLGAGNLDMLDARRSAEVRIDAGPPQEVFRLNADLKWVSFAVWHGEGEPLTGLLRELMEGEGVELRYYLYGGGYKSTRLSLAGAKATVAELLGVRAEVSAEERETARELETALAAAADRCLKLLKKKQRQECLELSAACAAKKPGSAEELRACIEEGAS